MTSVVPLLVQLFDEATPIAPANESPPLLAIRAHCADHPLSLSDSTAFVDALPRAPRVDPDDHDLVRQLLLRQAVISNPVLDVANALVRNEPLLPATCRTMVIDGLWRIDSQIDDPQLLSTVLGLLDGWIREDPAGDWSRVLDPLIDRPRRPEIVIPAIRALGELPQVLHASELVRTAYKLAGLLDARHPFPTAYTPERLRPFAVHYPEPLAEIIADQSSLRLAAGSTLEAMPAVLTTPLIAIDVEHQILNGGFHQLFWNRADLADHCVRAFEALGLNELATVTQSAVAVYRANAPRLRPNSSATMLEDYSASASLRLFSTHDVEFADLHERRTISEAMAEYLPPRVAALAAALSDEPIDATSFATIPPPSTPLRPPPEPRGELEILAIHGSPDMPVFWRDIAGPVDVEYTAPMLEVQQYSQPIWGYSIESEASGLGAGASTVVAGFGWGGVVAVAAALARPVAGLFLVEPLLISALSGAVGAKTEYLLEEFVNAVKSDQPDAIRAYVDLLSGPGVWDAMSDAHKAFFREKTPWCAADVETVLGYFPSLERVADMGIPVTVVVGANSPEPMHAIGEAVCAAIPHARRVSIEGATHSILETHPAALVPHLQSMVHEIRSH